MDAFTLEHLAARRVLKARGIDPEHATEEQYLDAAEAVLAATATTEAPEPTLDDAVNGRTLAKFGIKDAKHIADVGVSEAEFLAAAVAEEQLVDLEIAAATRERERPAAARADDSGLRTTSLPVGVIAAQAGRDFLCDCGSWHTSASECRR